MRINRAKTVFILSGVFFSLFILPANVLAANAKTTSKTTSQSKPQDQTSGRITQSYNADPAVQIGMIVALKEKDPSTVVPLPPSQVDRLLGIVVPQSNAPIVLTPEKISQQQVLVATSGRHSILVSNQNGPIKVGDYLTISSISGIAMKAGQDQTQVVGQAAGTFSGTSGVISTVKLKDSTGKESTVSIGRTQLEINVSHNPLFQTSTDYVPGFLAKGAQTVSGKPVSVARIYTSMAILFVISVITGNVLYSGIRGGMIAIGRNPLSRKSIFRSLIETVIAGLIIFVSGVFAVYLLLKL